MRPANFCSQILWGRRPPTTFWVISVWKELLLHVAVNRIWWDRWVVMNGKHNAIPGQRRSSNTPLWDLHLVSSPAYHKMNIFTWINVVYSKHQEFILLVLRSSVPPLTTSPRDGLGDTDTSTALTRTLQRRSSIHNSFLHQIKNVIKFPGR